MWTELIQQLGQSNWKIFWNPDWSLSTLGHMKWTGYSSPALTLQSLTVISWKFPPSNVHFFFWMTRVSPWLHGICSTRLIFQNTCTIHIHVAQVNQGRKLNTIPQRENSSLAPTFRHQHRIIDMCTVTEDFIPNITFSYNSPKSNLDSNDHVIHLIKKF